MPSFVIAIAFIFLCLSRCLDKLYNSSKCPEKFLDFIYYSEKLCVDFFLQLVAFALAHTFIEGYTGFDIYAYLVSSPLFPYILTGDVFFFIFLKYNGAKNIKPYRYIENIKNTRENPKKDLFLLLRATTAFLKIWQEKIGILKSLSPIPVVLLVLNNFSGISFTFDDIWEVLSKDKINIITLLVLVIYSYWMITTYFRIKESLLLISKIENELYSLDCSDSSDSDSPSR